MTNDRASATSVVLKVIQREAEDDYVGIWKIPWHLRRVLPHISDREVFDLSREVVRALIEAGLALGELDGDTGVFMPWPVEGSQARAMDLWRRLGRDPTIGEVCWVAEIP